MSKGAGLRRAAYATTNATKTASAAAARARPNECMAIDAKPQSSRLGAAATDHAVS